MKSIIVLCVLFLSLLTINTYGQTPAPEVITVNVSDLTPGQLAKIKADAVAADLATRVTNYGKWAGMGKEVGTAVKEGLMSVVDVADKFGGTKVGTFTMYMVAWKVIGQDLVRIFLGILFMCLITVLIFKSLRVLSPRKVRIKGHWLKPWEPSEYQMVEPEDFEGIIFVRIIHLFLLAGAFGITYAIMFV
jgi:hypothetical protein